MPSSDKELADALDEALGAALLYDGEDFHVFNRSEHERTSFIRSGDKLILQLGMEVDTREKEEIASSHPASIYLKSLALDAIGLKNKTFDVSYSEGVLTFSARTKEDMVNGINTLAKKRGVPEEFCVPPELGLY